jgi:CheY-like chemotaxis protein
VLPAAEAVADVAPAPVTAAAAGAGSAPDEPLRILLAEDNPVNQRVTGLLLERLGHRADVVPNGREAVDAVARGGYDLVLMDLHMPEMDGLAATRAIRAGLPPERQPYVVALTASALTDDLEASRTAGMDGHLSKPTRVKDLDRVLTAVLAHRGTRGPDGLPGVTVPRGEVGGRSAATGTSPAEEAAAIQHRLEELGTGDADLDRQLFDEILASFLTDGPGLVERMRAAARTGDARGLATVAHTLKGSAGNLAMTGLCAACQTLEDRAATGDCAAAAALLPTVDTAYTTASRAAELLRTRLTGAAR